ncbi:uncharacterized protein LOC127508133 isoform X13 [Ctenopharyngodon idella]|uniref:uncharacterized protein LOC127508133 isoform X13 n=1 Tax=Ctenopharyngodon idella TaxID=7959 RepID=UPI002230480D|nr:uncharacterized protein LOC127508133 isoform X13 [Ctenopharyngodon idella]
MSRRRCALRCDSKATFFSLPKDEHVKNQWLKLIFTAIPQKYSPNLVLCSRHFTDDCFLNLNAFNEGFASRLLLKDGSVPSLCGPASSSSESQPMLTMNAHMDVICCKSVGTDLSMLDIEDFISEICQLKKEVASLEAKLRERGDKPNREDLEKVSVCVTDGTEAQDSVWRSRDTQDSELSLTLLCYTDAQDHGSADQTSDCNAGEQQMLQTPLKMCSVKLVDCRNLIESRGEKTTAEEQQQRHEEEEDDDQIKHEDEDQNDDVDDDDFIPSGSIWLLRICSKFSDRS